MPMAISLHWPQPHSSHWRRHSPLRFPQIQLPPGRSWLSNLKLMSTDGGRFRPVRADFLEQFRALQQLTG